MDRLNILGNNNERFGEFTKELLAETDDKELQQIVKKAAKDLNSPMALVSLVLDQVQFFKAHIGLPPALKSARGTHSDASFCQFVVRDGITFEVNDAPNDPRVPKHVVDEYDVKSYLGVPVMINDVVVGSLCVLDTNKRDFTHKEHTALNNLAKLVNLRLDAITKSRKHSRLDLSEKSLQPVLSELSKSLTSIESLVKLGYANAVAIRTFIDHTRHLSKSAIKESKAFKLTYDAAIKANQKNESNLLEMEMSVLDGADYISALEQLVLKIESTPLSKLVIAAQDLSRNATKAIGGFPLPHFNSDPFIYTNSNLATAIISNCLLMISSELLLNKSKNGIQLKLNEATDFVELIFIAKDLSTSSAESVALGLKQLINENYPSVWIDKVDDSISLKLKTVH